MKRAGKAFLVLTAVLFFAVGCGGAGTAADTEQPAYEVREYSAERDGLRIYGELYLPIGAEEEKLPAVILSHSAALTGASMRSYCAGFAERGYIAYAFDFCGGSTQSRSDGETADMTIFTEKEDLNAVLTAVAQLGFVDENEIYLFGTSQGGLVSALTANDRAEDVAGMILLYPAFNIAELVQSASSSSYSFAFSSSFPMPETGEAFRETLLGFDVFEHIGNYGGRVLILHGTLDFIVPYSYSERAKEVYEHCELYPVEGASHGFNAENYSFFGNFDDEVWGQIDLYLAQN